ncbi:ExeA family protein [Paraferrimonas sedimenticola]|uniref:MSHA biogenesis protein MshM n=1 Tax=Paraferrimonas sedimenticola TaxID=375674 RepID=A0AA37VZ41_9GAMM|nr:AAA family ATPase [Paraferrimonas sedimenticola]GLP97391.1 MSHA biogenesis protein MshM [Paraferrimonas sedimenticola]
MYLQHFGLATAPFSLTPNTSFFFGLAPHVEALQVLHTALVGGEGFIKVTGEVGTGKTLICRKLLNDMAHQFACVYLPNPYLSPQELRWAVACELGFSYSAKVDQQQLIQLIHEKLLSLAEQGKRAVIVVDEAQALPDESLEALRLFTNLETETSKLLQVVLLGQPELDQRLAQDKFRQLRQRIGFSYQLRPLTEAEIHGYVEHRLKVAGWQGGAVFEKGQIRQLYKASRGIPRLVNLLCHKGLLLAYGAGVRRVSAKQLKAAIADTEDANSPMSLRAPVLGLTLGLAAAVLWYWLQGSAL